MNALIPVTLDLAIVANYKSHSNAFVVKRKKKLNVEVKDSFARKFVGKL